MRIRHLVLSVIAGLLAVGVSASAAAASPPARPIVTAGVVSLGGETVAISYSVNRGVQQIASVSYSLNRGPAAQAPMPMNTGKRSSSDAFNVTGTEGANVLVVTVTLTDGGVATSNEVTFTYTAGPDDALRVACEALPGGTFTSSDNPATPNTELFACDTAAFLDAAFAATFQAACEAASGLSGLTGTEVPPRTTYVCASLDPYLELRVACEALPGGTFTSSDNPATPNTELFACDTAAFLDAAFAATFQAACEAASGLSGLTGTEVPPRTTYVCAGVEN